MPDTCSAVGCKNRRQKKQELEEGNELHFYRIPWGNIPEKTEKRRLWLRAICREHVPEHARICSAHFISGRASDDPEDPDYVPSLFAYSGRAESPSEKCCIPNCPNDSRYNRNKTLSFHPFPKGGDMRSRWLEKITDKFGRDTCQLQVTKSTRICSKHFRKMDIVTDQAGGRKVKSRVVPSKFKLSRKVAKRAASKHKSECQELAKEPSRCDRSETEMEQESPSSNSGGGTCCSGLSRDVTKQMQQAKDQIQSLEDRCKTLVNKLFLLERFSSDAQSMRFYTGFADYATFKAVFSALQPTGKSNVKRWCEVQKYCRQSMGMTSQEDLGSSLQLIDEFFMFMCFLRQGFCEQDLAIRFSISKTVVTEVLLTWINYLFVSLRKFQVWPSRKSIEDNMPACFKTTYPHTRVILDSSEVTVQMPGSVFHKHSSPDVIVTCKGLLGISPLGAVTFVSDLYIGSISDCQITEFSRVLNLMAEPSIVLAPESFAIQDPSHPHKSTIVVPPFWSRCRRAQYKTTEMAKLRHHIEGALGYVKDYGVFRSVIPKTLAESANQMWMVCALLANFKRSIHALP